MRPSLSLFQASWKEIVIDKSIARFNDYWYNFSMEIKWNRKYKILATEIESSHEDGLHLTGFFIARIHERIEL